MANNSKFRNDIKKHIAKSKNALNDYAKKVILELDSRVVLKSPVLSGALRYNWVLGNGYINNQTSEFVDKSGLEQISKTQSFLNSLNITGQTIYITNSLPYAYRIEYEGWSKIKAPAGMVRVTLAELNSVLNGAAFEVKGKYA